MITKILKRLIAVVLVLSFFTVQLPFLALADDEPVIKNVIFMIPDGAGFALFDLANAVKEQGGFKKGLYPNSTQIEAGPMYMKQYLVGTSMTYSASSEITDSAAGGTALSSGYKTNNAYVGADPDGRPHATLLEAAQLQGKKAGLVTTVEWTNATPADFSAHSTQRYNSYPEMSEQILNQKLDVVLPYGFIKAQFGSMLDAKKRGYTKNPYNKEQLAEVKQGDKVWGSRESYAKDIVNGATVPTLAEMTEAAIRAMDGTDEGFFLMVEGSLIDAGGHNNDAVYTTGDYLSFDAAFKVAVEYAKARNDTLVIAVPDHDTGGLILPNKDEDGGNPNSADYADEVAEVINGTNTKKLSWTSKSHTARDVGVWIYAPEGVKLPDGLAKTPGDTPETRALAIENYEVALYVADLMGVDLDKVTEELFADYTPYGTYDAQTGLFTFNDKDISVYANQSVATVGNETYDMDGKVTVYSREKFYGPKELLDLQYREVPVNKARYIDEETGNVLVKGQLGMDYAGQPLVVMLYKKAAGNISEDDIGYIRQIKARGDGSYAVNFTFTGDIDDYELKIYAGDETVTDTVTSAKIGYSWLDSSVELSKDGSLADSKIAIKDYCDIEGLEYMILLCFYDESGNLIGTKVTDTKDISDSVTYDELQGTIPRGTKTVKSAVWSNFTKIIPISKTDSLTVN